MLYSMPQKVPERGLKFMGRYMNASLLEHVDLFDAVQHATESAGKGRLKFMGRHMNASLLEHVD